MMYTFNGQTFCYHLIYSVFCSFYVTVNTVGIIVVISRIVNYSHDQFLKICKSDLYLKKLESYKFLTNNLNL